MKSATVAALAEINRRFYTEQADAFSETRAEPWPGWVELLPAIRETAHHERLEVLDVGCGNGRFLRYLAKALPELRIAGTGVDGSAPLLDAARTRDTSGARFAACDFVAAPESLPKGPFSLVALFGVLHGVPGRERRRALLGAAAARLAAGGLLVFSIWRLAADPRIAGRILDLREHAARFGVDPGDLEPGDCLLPWGAGDQVVRYVSEMSEAELAAHVADLPLPTPTRFRADGRSGDLNEYLVFRVG